MLKRSVVLVTLLAFGLAGPLAADTVKGRIKTISKRASTIALKTAEPSLVRYGPSTEFVNATGIKELGTNDLINVEFSPGQPATRITKVVFELDAALQLDTPALEQLIAGGRGPYTLIDARPQGPYLAGHIPTAKSIFGKELEKRLDELPADKDALIVFYCGGPTCPFTGMSIKVAQANGYTNVLGYQIGIPAWKKAGKPVHASPQWVAKRLNENNVILDVRPADASARGHLPSAVAMPAGEFTELTKQFIATRAPARLPGVADKGAPIVIYGDTDDGADVMASYAELKKWKYRSVAILEGGLAAWKSPLASGPAAGSIRYVRAPKAGAVSPQEFAALEAAGGDVMLLDVRSAKETSGGVVKNAVHIPLDNLEGALDRVPRDGRVVTYCANGTRAQMAYELLKGKGYSNVSYLDASVKVDADGTYALND